jgi:RimJ/RimL family protein N-acetyltransferase
LLVTPRLVIRPPAEADRERFIELFSDAEFMVFFEGAPRTADEASCQFDRMLASCAELPFGKQPVIERASGTIVGYTGVDWFTLDGEQCLEWGYRLAPQYRGLGYTTEASQALLAVTRDTFAGDIYAIIHPGNLASQNVARKLGFSLVGSIAHRMAQQNLYRLSVG